jgi:hypothetical protein
MKALALLLLLANLGLFAYLQIDRLGASEADRLSQQVQPEKLKPFTAAQVKAMALDKPATPALASCLEWGPFSEAERTRAQPLLEGLGSGRGITSKPVEVTTAYWVFVPPQANKTAAEKKMAELKALGVTEMYLVQDQGPQRLAISLGLFRSEEAANSYLAGMLQLGVKTAKLAPRTQTLSQTLLVLRDPPAEALARLAEFKNDFPGAEVKQAACNGKAGA